MREVGISRGLHLTQQPIILLFASTICQKQIGESKKPDI